LQEPEVLDKGSIVTGGIKVRGVVDAMRIARESLDNEERAPLSPDYMDKNVSLKVA
jgi:UDP-N-acetylglucosamine 2-epimerase (non-hydrolysing)